MSEISMPKGFFDNLKEEEIPFTKQEVDDLICSQNFLAMFDRMLVEKIVLLEKETALLKEHDRQFEEWIVETRKEIDRCYLPAEHPPKKHDCHLIHHG